jgi:3-hydroxyacyl-CoA dehydrogenase
MAMAKVSSSAAAARALDFLVPADQITMNRNHLIEDARATAIALAEAGCSSPASRTTPTAGEGALANLTLGIHLMRQAEYISDHDAKIARCAPCRQRLWRCSHARSLIAERLAFALKTGKPPRN